MTAVLLAPVVPRCCRWCGQPVVRWGEHLADTGDATVPRDGACVALFEMRQTKAVTG